MQPLENALKDLALGVGLILAAAVTLAVLLRRRGLRWTWALLGLPASWMVGLVSGNLGLWCLAVALLAALLGAVWHHSDLAHGADFAEAAHARLGLLQATRGAFARRRARTRGWVSGGWLRLGHDERGMPVSIPVGYESGCHTLVLGATGAGKTISETWIATRLIEAGHGAVVIDPKGDPALCHALQGAAHARGARFYEWTPDGPLAYNPYGSGSEGEIADKALAGEHFTEPHYQRQAQRYLAHTVRVMHAAGIPVTPVSLLAHMDPRQLELSARGLPEAQAAQVQAYLDSLSERQQRELAGVRDRLAILAESEVHPALEPEEGRETLDLYRAVRERAVVYLRLDADRRPLLAAMLASAIVIDLVTLVGRLQQQPTPTVVAIDEFSAVAAGQVARLFGRARSAGISLILATQELADLQSVGEEALREKVLANVEVILAHRQNVPQSAELIAAIAGTKPVWITTQQTEDGLLGGSESGRGSRRRGHEFRIHPDRIKSLPTGWAVVVTPGAGQAPGVVRVNCP
jgi:conjugal transfer pilus assembly protein TraD